MAQLEDIVQKITVEGGSELGSTLGEIGHAGVEAFEKIAIAARTAGTAIGIATGGLTIIAGLLVTAALASTKFVEGQVEVAQRLQATAKQLGITASEVTGLNAAFASVGIDSPQIVGRVMSQVAKDIGKAWTEIPNKIAQGRIAMQEATQGIASAQTQLSQSFVTARFAGDEWANKLTSNALSVEEAYRKVARASQDAARQARGDALGIAGAKLDLEEAEAKLSESRGGFGISDYRKKQIEQERLDLDVKQKKGALEDKITDQGRHAEDAPATAAKASLELSNALIKQSKDLASVNDALRTNQEAIEKNTTALEKANLTEKTTSEKDINNIAAKLTSGQKIEGADGKEIADAIKANVIESGGNISNKLDFFERELRALGAAVRSGAVDASQQGDIQGGFGIRLRGGQQAQATNLDPDKLADLVAKAKDPNLDKSIANLEKLGVTLAEEKVSRSRSELQAAGALAPVAEVTSAAITGGLEKISDGIVSVRESIDKLIGVTAEKNGQGHATGGFISGPGTSTSDSIPARLSHGEFVMQASAVRNYGVGFMHALNSGMLQGFASGGYAGPSRPSYAGTGEAAGPHSIVNLTIDGNKFGGLRAPLDVAQKMTKYAVGQQTASTGRKPSWVS